MCLDLERDYPQKNKVLWKREKEKKKVKLKTWRKKKVPKPENLKACVPSPACINTDPAPH